MTQCVASHGIRSFLAGLENAEHKNVDPHCRDPPNSAQAANSRYCALEVEYEIHNRHDR